MTQQFAVGDRVVIQGFGNGLDGREGTVTEAEFSAARAYPYRVRLDNDEEWDYSNGRLFTARELVAVSKPVPEPGTRIRVVGPAGSMLHHSHIGKVGKVVERPAYGYRDSYDVFMDDGTNSIPLALYADEYEIVEPTPTPQFASGDRVVYTIPETYLGYPGENSAVRPAGSTGTVVAARSAESVKVEWDADPTAWVATAFLAHAPKPTHKYPEGLYRVGQQGVRVFIRHAPDGSYSIAYIDERTARGDVPVNNDMTEVIVGSYTLITAA